MTRRAILGPNCRVVSRTSAEIKVGKDAGGRERRGDDALYRKYGSAEGLFAHDEGEGAAAHDVAVRQERSAEATAIRTPLTAPAIRAAKATILLTVISAAIL